MCAYALIYDRFLILMPMTYTRTYSFIAVFLLIVQLHKDDMSNMEWEFLGYPIEHRSYQFSFRKHP